MDEEPELVVSRLSKEFTRDGITVSVEIYRLAEQSEWTLEVVTADKDSVIWDDPFETDQAAYDEFLKAVEEEGLAALIDPEGGETLH
ncbi:hypothetical protein HB779_10600 [Phyllobacterium sp. 628]|uniref:hypothetical protein n=1 Tax=Phyllobacterium sp. 628 TaxID=2718938 RepID=UPI0016626C6A|nr:hypothetical protein [Phyllobacterium sp. 628]QND52310.1 hypothetical protein HB779_10600 [Phyllobacterium sp. 628]